jgi:hypothetical protein
MNANARTEQVSFDGRCSKYLLIRISHSFSVQTRAHSSANVCTYRIVKDLTTRNLLKQARIARMILFKQFENIAIAQE